MNLNGAEAALEEAKRQANSAVKHISLAQGYFSEPCSELCSEHANSAFSNLTKALLTLNEAMDGVNETCSKEQQRIRNDKAAHQKVEQDIQSKISCEYITPNIFHCILKVRPLLKNSRATAIIGDKISSVLRKELLACQNSPDISQFEKYRVVYINHVESEHSLRPSYFDNDNLAIKNILDVILHRVCYDDAAIFCDNIYITERDAEEGEPYSELFVINQNHFLEWMNLGKNYSFVKEISQFSSQ